MATVGRVSTAGSPRTHKTGGGSLTQLRRTGYPGSHHARGFISAFSANASASLAREAAVAIASRQLLSGTSQPCRTSSSRAVGLEIFRCRISLNVEETLERDAGSIERA